MKIVVIGGTGLIGSKLVTKLSEHGHDAIPASPRLGIDAPTAMKVFDPRPGVDEVWPGKGVIYSQRLTAQRTKSRLGKIVGTSAYRSMTIRSWATTMRLLELMEAPQTDEPL